MGEKQKTVSDLFGITDDELEKSKNIKPNLDLGTMEINSQIMVEFLDTEPIEVETPQGKYSKSALVIGVKLLDGTNAEYSLFLSSKTLRLGVAKLYDESKNLIGQKVIIKKTRVNFKNFGENDCYNVIKISGDQEKI